MHRALVLLALAASASAGSYSQYDRCDMAHGPAFWKADNGSYCSAQQQSPIDLCGAHQLGTFSYRDARYKLKVHDAAAKKKMTVLKKGQAKFQPTGTDFAYYVNSNEIAYLVGRQTDKPQAEGDSKWKFAEANFHWGRNGRKNEGSEHYLEGVQYPLEVHYVHHHSKYSDLAAALSSGKSDALLVVGQFFNVDDSEAAVEQETMRLLAGAMGEKKDEVATNQTEVEMAPYGLIDQSEGFYTYPGSLTTPTCNPVVTWVVMNKVAIIKSSTLDLFHDNTPDADGNKATWGNYRPLQRKGDRKLYFSWGDAATTFTTFKGTHCHPWGAREPEFQCEHESDCIDTETTLYNDTAAITLGVLFGICCGATIILCACSAAKNNTQQPSQPVNYGVNVPQKVPGPVTLHQQPPPLMAMSPVPQATAGFPADAAMGSV